jgi:predicted nucleotide-binding protein (sugar kinase/HSP70/actin superfamily)
LQRQYQDLQQQRQGVLNAYMQAQEQAKQTREQYQSEQVQKGYEQVKKAIPDFNEGTQRQLRDFAKTIGYSEAELSNLSDPRAVIILHKAAQFDQLMKSKPEVNKKVANAPKTLQVKAQAPKQNQAEVLKKIVRTSKDRQSKHNAIQKLMERMV